MSKVIISNDKAVIKKFTDMMDSEYIGETLWAYDHIPIPNISDFIFVNKKLIQNMIDSYMPLDSQVTEAIYGALIREFNMKVFSESERISILLPFIVKSIKNNDSGNFSHLLVSITKEIEDQKLQKKY